MIMISYYNRGTEEKPFWEVYGIEGEHTNTHLGTFDNEYAALILAHSYVLPVMRGDTNSYLVAKTIRKLLHPTQK